MSANAHDRSREGASVPTKRPKSERQHSEIRELSPSRVRARSRRPHNTLVHFPPPPAFLYPPEPDLVPVAEPPPPAEARASPDVSQLARPLTPAEIGIDDDEALEITRRTRRVRRFFAATYRDVVRDMRRTFGPEGLDEAERELTRMVRSILIGTAAHLRRVARFLEAQV